MESLRKRLDVLVWETGNQKGCDISQNWFQTYVKCRTVMNWGKDKISEMEEDYEQDENKKTK